MEHQVKKALAIIEVAKAPSNEILHVLRELQLLSSSSVKMNRVPMVELGVVQPLLRLIRRCMSYEVMTSAACAVLWNLAACSENQSRLVDEGCLAVLREAVVPPFEHFETIGNALHTLIWLSVCRENQVAMVEYGLVQDLLALSAEIPEAGPKVTLVGGPKLMPGIGPLADLERAKQDILYNAARVIHNLACHPMNKGPMIDQKIGVVEPLVEAALKEPPNDYESKLLLANDDDARRLRLMALQTLASLANADGEGADLMMESNVLPKVLDVIRDEIDPLETLYVRKQREKLREKAVNTVANLIFRNVDKHRGTFMMHGTAEALQGLMVQERAGYVQLRAAMALADLVGGNEEFSGRVVKQITEVLRHAVHGTDFFGYKWDVKSPLLSLLRICAPKVGKLAGAETLALLMQIIERQQNGEYDETIGKLAQDVVSQIHTVRPSQEFLDKHGLGSFDPGDFPVSDVKFAKYAKSEEEEKRIFYTMKIKCHSCADWSVVREYDEFLRLEQKTALSRGRMPAFPGQEHAKIMFGFKDQVLFERAEGLQEWLRALIVRAHQIPELQPALKDFLGVGIDHAPEEEDEPSTAAALLPPAPAPALSPTAAEMPPAGGAPAPAPAPAPAAAADIPAALPSSIDDSDTDTDVSGRSESSANLTAAAAGEGKGGGGGGGQRQRHKKKKRGKKNRQ